MFKKPLWQTVWTQIGAVCSGFTLFNSILNLSVLRGNYLQQTTSADDIFRCIFGALRVKSNCAVHMDNLMETNTKEAKLQLFLFRHHFWEGPGQDVQLNSNVHYSFVGYVKLLSMAPGHNYHATEAILTCQDSHGNIVAFIFRLLCIMQFIFST